jgi:hypothetical protein
VTLIIANSIRHGAGLANVAFARRLRLAIMIAIVGIGLTSLIAGMATGSNGCG